MKTFTLRLSDDEYDRLNGYCTVRERKMSDVVRELIRSLPKDK